MRVLFYISVELSLGSGREELKTENMGKTFKKVYLFIFVKENREMGQRLTGEARSREEKNFFCNLGKIGNSSRFV